ncbi:ABC transporter permease [candidate division KSB1 bacterium]|nr:ABC transporter permease [candidate division KSB1 bacterium]
MLTKNIKSSRKTLIRSSLRYITKHPWQFGLSVLGIALGVAVVVAIDLANQSAGKAFTMSMQQVSGKVTHHIMGGPTGVPDSLYRDLRVKLGITQCAPIIEGNCSVPTEPPRICTLLGIDPFAEHAMRPEHFPVITSRAFGRMNFMIQPNAILLPAKLAADLNVTAGDTTILQINNQQQTFHIAGVLNAESDDGNAMLENIILADIATAQELLNMPGRLSRIDLVVPDNRADLLDRIQTRLDDGYRIIPAAMRQAAGEQMTHSFELNLTAMSVLALIVGMFLIYNTMTFSVVQRRIHIGLMRSIGVTRRELFTLMMVEALVMGILGTLLGLGFGVLLGKGLVKLVTQSINDLYYVLNVRQLYLSQLSLLKGLGLGVVATLVAAIKPAREATTAPPRVTLIRSQVETNIHNNIPRFTAIGVSLMVIGMAILLYPVKNIWFSYAGLMPLVSGLALLTPITMTALVRLASPLMKRMFGLLGEMASRSIVTQMSRTAVAIAALSIAVATTVGVGTMVDNMRNTVIEWMERLLTADIYISTPSLIGRQSSSALDVAMADRLQAVPGVKHVNYYREVQLDTEQGYMIILAAKIGEFRYNNFAFKQGLPKNIWPAFQHEDAVLVSEPYSYKNNINLGDTVMIPTDRGPHAFRVVGVHYEYGTDLGLIAMSHWNYQKYFDDRKLSRILIYTEPDADIDAIKRAIWQMAPPNSDLVLQSNHELLKASVVIFDRTFLITRVLQLLAIIVAFIGVLSALMALQLERSREFGVLRAIGLTPGQLWKLVLLQTGFMGFIAGILSIPIGNIVAWVLIHVVNERSFGWTIHFDIMPYLLVQAIGLAILAAVVAGLYPAYKLATISPAMALRDE